MQRACDFGLQAFDDRPRRGSRCKHTRIGFQLVAGQTRRRDGRQRGKQRRRLRAGHRQRTQTAGEHMRGRRTSAGKHHLHLRTEQRIESRPGAAKRHAHDVHTGHDFKEFAREMTRRTD